MRLTFLALHSHLLPAPPLPNPPALKLTSIKMSSCQFVSFKLASVQFASPNAFFVNFSPSGLPLPNLSRSHLLSPAFIKELITNIFTGPAHLYQAYLYSTSLYRIYLFQIAIYRLSRGRLFFIGFTFTSSTAQGGGGSFKKRKPIGELGCCE